MSRFQRVVFGVMLLGIAVTFAYPWTIPVGPKFAGTQPELAFFYDGSRVIEWNLVWVQAGVVLFVGIGLGAFIGGPASHSDSSDE